MLLQTANSKELWKGLGPAYYEFIIVEEAHHAPAASYKGIFTGFADGAAWLGEGRGRYLLLIFY